jgi:ArsR family transcriptional regulator
MAIFEYNTKLTMKKKVHYRTQVRIHKALANETRLQILDLLHEKECNVGELTNLVGLDQSTVSKHLTILLTAGIVDYRKEGNTVFYRLITPCIMDMFTCARQVLKK